MPYYKKLKLLFIHIPKTGGTVIETAIKTHCEETLYTSYKNDILPYPFCDYSLQHQFYSTIYKYRELLNVNFDNIKVFTVVRNPYDRVISDLLFLKIINKNTTADNVYYVIKNNYINHKKIDNHHEPQYKYLVDENQNLISNIRIFNTETLNENNDKLNEYIGINIDIKKNDCNKDYTKYLNIESINLINEMYKKDFELFGYTLIT